MRDAGKKLFAVLFAALTVCGCQHSPRAPVMALPTATAAGEVAVLRNVQFADVPAPQNFRFNRRLSHNFQGSALRGGVVVYDGILTVGAASDWYLAEMPKTGWQYVKSEIVKDYDIRHVFAKGDELATLRIWRPAGGNARVEIALDKESN
ncbi:hypothetical protein AGMMS49959_14960 [Planctomycetales bacterium]|nr:hypothetical protein AGMMS49959_14960 [Planctomycetales bacterium]